MSQVMVCGCCGKWRIEQVVLNGRTFLRIKSHGFFVADVTTVEQALAVLADNGIDVTKLTFASAS